MKINWFMAAAGLCYIGAVVQGLLMGGDLRMVAVNCCYATAALTLTWVEATL